MTEVADTYSQEELLPIKKDWRTKLKSFWQLSRLWILMWCGFWLCPNAYNAVHKNLLAYRHNAAESFFSDLLSVGQLDLMLLGLFLMGPVIVWFDRWGVIEEPLRRKFAHLWRTQGRLYEKAPKDDFEREERRQLLEIVFASLEAKEARLHALNTSFKFHGFDDEILSQIIAEFRDAKRFISEELKILLQQPNQPSTRFKFTRVNGEAEIEHEGRGVKRVTIRINQQGVYVLDRINGEEREFLGVLNGWGEVACEFSRPVSSGYLRIIDSTIINSHKQVIEEIPLP